MAICQWDIERGKVRTGCCSICSFSPLCSHMCYLCLPLYLELQLIQPNTVKPTSYLTTCFSTKQVYNCEASIQEMKKIQSVKTSICTISPSEASDNSRGCRWEAQRWAEFSRDSKAKGFTGNEQFKKEIKKTIIFIVVPRGIAHLYVYINLIKKVEDLYSENYWKKVKKT